MHNIVRFCTEIRTIPSAALVNEDKKYDLKYLCMIEGFTSGLTIMFHEKIKRFKFYGFKGIYCFTLASNPAGLAAESDEAAVAK